MQHEIADVNVRIPSCRRLPLFRHLRRTAFLGKHQWRPARAQRQSRPFDDSLESELVLDLDNLQLAKYLAYSPVDLPIKVLSGALEGDLRFRFLQTKGQPSTLSLGGKMAPQGPQGNRGWRGAADRAEARGATPICLFRIGIERAALESPEIDVRIDKQGELWPLPASRLGITEAGRSECADAAVACRRRRESRTVRSLDGERAKGCA